MDTTLGARVAEAAATVQEIERVRSFKDGHNASRTVSVVDRVARKSTLPEPLQRFRRLFCQRRVFVLMRQLMQKPFRFGRS